MRQSVNRSTLTVLLTFVMCIAGCGGGGPTEEVQQLTSNMQGLANAYGQCTSQNRGRPPRNEAQLRKFIESQGPDWLQQYQAETVDDIFMSSRDGKPYVVLYGKPGLKYIAYEQESRRRGDFSFTERSVAHTSVIRDPYSRPRRGEGRNIG